MASPVSELSIVRCGDPMLRRPTRTVGRVTREVRDLIARMIPALRAANGLGLAANQVGAPLRVAVIEGKAARQTGEEDSPRRPVPVTEEGVIVLVDPELIEAQGSEVSDEGCLSLPRLYGMVERPTRVVVTARDLSGKRHVIEGEGLFARALCHEIDHLKGRLFVDLPALPAAGGPPCAPLRLRKGPGKGGQLGAVGRLDRASLYWLLGYDEEGQAITQPTTLEGALRAFTAAKSRMVGK